MALINHEKKEINAKIVYYGPGLSGKTTNIKYIYDKMKPEFRGKFKLLNTNSGKMLFFDFMRPDQIGIQDYDVRFHIYTVPGDISDFSIWKTVLKGTDGLVFVADCEPYKLADNLQSYDKLKEYLETLPADTRDFPCIMQCNKQDIPGATSLDEMKDLLHSTDLRMIPASTRKGEGILNTLSTIVKMVIQKLQNVQLSKTEDTAVVVPEAETAQPAFTGENVLSGEPSLQMPPVMEEGGPSEPAREVSSELKFSFTPEMGVTLGEYGAEADETQEAIQSPPEIYLNNDSLQHEVAPITELSPMEEESAFEPVQDIPANQEYSFAQETERISSEIYLSGDNLQYDGTPLTEPPPLEEESAFEPAQEITPEQEFSFGQDMVGTTWEQPANAAETPEIERIPTEIDLAGEMELVAPGHFRLPVAIKFGGEIKTLAIDLKLSIEIPQT